MLILELSAYFNILHISGEKSAEFLQSQLTNDVQEVNAEHLQWQAYCSRQGLVQSIFGLWGKGQDYYILIAKDLIEPTLSLLQKYGVFSKVQFKLFSPKISLALEEQAEKNLTWDIKTFSENQLQLIWRSHFPPKLSSLAHDKDGNAVMRVLFIQHQFPYLAKETMNLFRAHDLNLPELSIVSFKKGCFPGQEIIARTQYRGKPKQSLVVFDFPLQQKFFPAQVLMEGGKQIGQVVDAVDFEHHTYLSAIVVHDALMLKRHCLDSNSLIQ